MKWTQREFVEKCLFDYYVVSSAREEEVISQLPYYLEEEIWKVIINAASVLDNLVRRIIKETLSSEVSFNFGDFPFFNEIFEMKLPLMPFFWARFDVFKRADGGVFFSEFNYDKPCAQREIYISKLFDLLQNPSADFSEKFNEGFRSLCSKFYDQKQNLVVGILVDPSHYEELHLAYLYIDILKPLGYDFVIIGGNNLQVVEGKVIAFDKQIDVILKQYPTEFLYEISCFEEILNAYNNRRVLLLNDPRAIFGQVKSLFAFLWEMVEKDDEFLSLEEKQVVKETIPYTRIYEGGLDSEILKNRKKLVIKAAYGRYSEEVYIGCMFDDTEWKELLDYISKSDELYIVQEFCHIKEEVVPKYDGIKYKDENVFGNFGVYLVNGNYAGICVRWSTDYLSHDEIVWSTAVGIRKRSLQVESEVRRDRHFLWNDISDEAAFNWHYTGSYAKDEEAFTLERLILDNDTYSEIEKATELLVDVFKRTTRFVQENHELFFPVLGIADGLYVASRENHTDKFTFIGRFDWVVDSKGSLKLLELNSETPGGLLESIILNSLIKKKIGIDHLNPNKELGNKIRKAFASIVEDYKMYGDIKSIGIVSSSYHEDWFTVRTLFDIIKDLPYDFTLGEVSGLTENCGKLWLYGKPLDAVYRYYPLDWFEKDHFYKGIVKAFENETLSINPASTIISQSKAFLALIWELCDNGYYNDSDAKIINKYIPRTALTPKKLESYDYCIKPFFGREGESIVFNIFGGPKLEGSEYVFQERVEIQKIEMGVFNTSKGSKMEKYPVIGAYIIGDKFAGIYTRAGGRVTDKSAIYIPTYIKND